MILKLRLILLLSLGFTFSACQKEFTIDDGNIIVPPAGTAVFTFPGTPGICSSALISGRFQVGTALDTSNKIIVQLDVITIGTYSILSNSSNGITFSAAGTFTTTGLQTIILNASGTVLATGLYNFTLGNSGCAVSIPCIGGGSNNNNCKGCIYVPLCVGSRYTYSDTSYGIPSIKTIDLLSTVDTTIDARIYQKITATNGAAYYNCTNGETTVVGYMLVSNNGNILQKYKSTMLKANAAVGDTWSDTLTNPAGQTVIQNFSIGAKGVSKTVGTFNFTNVIVVSLETGLVAPLVGYFPVTLSYYYYAKGVGLIEVTTRDLNSGQDFYHSAIKSYYIP